MFKPAPHISLNMFAANPTFDRAGSDLKFRGGGGFDPP